MIKFSGPQAEPLSFSSAVFHRDHRCTRVVVCVIFVCKQNLKVGYKSRVLAPAGGALVMVWMLSYLAVAVKLQRSAQYHYCVYSVFTTDLRYTTHFLMLSVKILEVYTRRVFSGHINPHVRMSVLNFVFLLRSFSVT